MSLKSKSVEEIRNSVEPADAIVVLPLGAHEQHGPHLPAETDSVIAQGVCERLQNRLGSVNIHFLPTETVGYSVEHLDFPQTRSLTIAQALERWIGIGEKLNDAGIKKLIMMNAHGGNSPIMALVAQELRVRCSMLAVATSWTRFIKGSDVVDAAEHAFGIHGGDIETSVMLELAPQMVDMSRAENFPNLQQRLAETCTHLRAYGPHSFGWKAADLNLDGVNGDAAAASAEKGRKLLNIAVDGLAELVNDVAAFDLSALRD